MFLGIDIGTSGVKAVIIDDAGMVRADATAPLSISRPKALWSEQNPDDWWTATCEACNGLPSAMRKRVAAIGLSGQMHGATLLGGDDRPLRPAILWNDGRSEVECRELEASAPHLHEISGNLAMPGFTAPKLLWVRRHERTTFDACKSVLLPKDYVRLLMTGDKVSDMSDAAGTLWLDVGKRAWSDELLSATDLTQSHMPRLTEGSDVAGYLTKAAAGLMGLNAELPVAGGAGDNAASAVGMGAVNSQDAFLSLGTSGVIFVSDETFLPNPKSAVHAFCHALPERWHRMSVMLSAASALDWAASTSGYHSVADAVGAAETVPHSDNIPIFLPYLTGERTPHNDPFASGVYFGLSPATSAAHMVRSAMEGIAFGLAQGFEALCEASASPTAISVVGGGARSTFWGDILAATLDIPLHYREAAHVGAAYGAARLAMLCAGGTIDEVCTPPLISNTVNPDPILKDALSVRKRTFSALYPELRGLFQSMHATQK